jgi:hypothetical protein
MEDRREEDMLSTMECVMKERDEVWQILIKLMYWIDDQRDNAEGRWPVPNPGCVVCTAGTTPHALDTGPCVYHAAHAYLRVTKGAG